MVLALSATAIVVVALLWEIAIPRIEEWRERASQTFMASYREALAATNLWPTDAQAADQLLRFFLLQKAFYEVDYELANRPAWLRVPLVGLQRTMSLLKA